MSQLCLNCYGLGKSQAVQELCGMVKRLKPQIVFLSETRLLDAGVQWLRLSLVGVGMGRVGRVWGNFTTLPD